MDGIVYLLVAAITIYIYCVIAAAVMSWFVAFNVVNTGNRTIRAVVDFLDRITEPVLAPIRHVVPSIGGIDLSPVVLILLLLAVEDILIDRSPVNALGRLLITVLSLYMYATIATAVLSWLVAFGVLSPRHPVVGGIAGFFFRLTEPVLAPVRRYLPTLGGVDLSPVVVTLLLWFLAYRWIPGFWPWAV